MIYFGDFYRYYRFYDEYFWVLCNNINSYIFYIGYNFKSIFFVIVYSYFGYGVINLFKSNVYFN